MEEEDTVEVEVEKEEEVVVVAMGVEGVWALVWV